MKKRLMKKSAIWVLSIILIMVAIIIGVLAANNKNNEKTILYPVQINEKWGYINKTGKIVIEPTYAWADEFHDGVAVVLVKDSDGSKDTSGDENGKYGVIDTNGKLVVKPDFSTITKYNEGVAGAIQVDPVTYDQTYFVLDRRGKILYTLPAEMQIVSMLFNGMGLKTQSEGLILVQDDKTEMYGFIDRYGKLVIPYQYYEASSFSDGLALVKNNKNQYQYIDKSGRVMIDASKYVSVKSFSEGLAAVAVENKERSTVEYGYMDTKGNMKIKPQYTRAYSFSEGLAKVCVGESINEYSIGYIDESGAYKIAPTLNDSYDETLMSEGLVPIADGAGGYMDKEGKLSIAPVITKVEDNYLKHNIAGEFRNGVAKVSLSDGTIGYIDTTGKYIWDPRK